MRCKGENRCVAERFEPDDGGDVAVCGGRGLDAKMHFGRRGARGAILRVKSCGKKNEARHQAAEP
jgi:hypothetical protein